MHGKLDVELNIRKGRAYGRFNAFKKLWGSKQLSVSTKVKCIGHMCCLLCCLGVRRGPCQKSSHLCSSGCTLAVLGAFLGSSFLIGTAMHMSGSLYVVLHL